MAAGAYGWKLHHLHVPNVLKSGSLSLLEPSGPVQACVVIASVVFCVHVAKEVLILTYDLQAILHRHKRAVSGQYMWDFWWTKWQSEGPFSKYFNLILSISLYQFTIQSLIYHECYLVSAVSNDVK